MRAVKPLGRTFQVAFPSNRLHLVGVTEYGSTAPILVITCIILMVILKTDSDLIRNCACEDSEYHD